MTYFWLTITYKKTTLISLENLQEMVIKTLKNFASVHLNSFAPIVNRWRRIFPSPSLAASHKMFAARYRRNFSLNGTRPSLKRRLAPYTRWDAIFWQFKGKKFKDGFLNWIVSVVWYVCPCRAQVGRSVNRATCFWVFNFIFSVFAWH